MRRGHVALRMCVGCRQVKPKGELLRLVSQANGSLAVDGLGRSSGRGFYICYAWECVHRALRKGGLKGCRHGQTLLGQIASVLNSEGRD